MIVLKIPTQDDFQSSFSLKHTNIAGDGLPKSNPNTKAPMDENIAQMTLIHAIWNLGRISSIVHR
jgi:hypothetical protein